MPLFNFLLRKVSSSTVIPRATSKEHHKISRWEQGNVKGAHLKQYLTDKTTIKEMVKLPACANLDEWIAMNTMELFKAVTFCYRIISEYCSEDTCPKMTAGPKVTYYWADKKLRIKSMSLPANLYVSKLNEWIRGQLEDDSIFPPEGGDFNESFIPNVKKILSRMCRIYAHIYHHHWEEVQEFKSEVHINTCFKHFYYFTTEFNLLEDNDWKPLLFLIKQLETPLR